MPGRKFTILNDENDSESEDQHANQNSLKNSNNIAAVATAEPIVVRGRFSVSSADSHAFHTPGGAMPKLSLDVSSATPSSSAAAAASFSSPFLPASSSSGALGSYSLLPSAGTESPGNLTEEDIEDIDGACFTEQAQNGIFALKPLDALYNKGGSASTVLISHPLESEEKHRKKLHTFSGVFVPTCESMWGVIIFLRFGQLTGQAGVGFALFAVLISAICVLLSTMSLCAVGTNGKTPRGGTYYILTRSLGPALGGAVGLLYYIGLTVMSTVEVVGFTEGLNIILRDSQHINSITGSVYWDQVMIGAIVLFALCTGSFLGVKFVHKIGLVFLSGLVFAYVAGFFGLFLTPSGWATGPIDASQLPEELIHANISFEVTGLSSETLSDNWSADYSKSWDFKAVMTFIFPCFIGIFSGADMSGELKKPFRSIPRGTFAAILVSALLYFLIITLLGSVATREVLKEVELIFAIIAWPTKWVTLIGILLVSLGSGLQLLTIAPRILQSIASDGLLPPIRLFGFDRLWSEEPRRALFFTFFLAAPFIFLSDLDMIATIVTMCFLQCYAMMNLACFLLSILRTPDWRPQYRFYHWTLALLGFILCVILMFYIQFIAATVSIIITFVLCVFIQVIGSKKIWGSGIRGLQFHVALISLLGIEEEEIDHDLLGSAVSSVALSPSKNGSHYRHASGFDVSLEANAPRGNSISNGKFSLISNEADADGLQAGNDGSVSAGNNECDEQEQQKPEAWRPQILCFDQIYESGELAQPKLLCFINQLKETRGLTMVASVLETSKMEPASEAKVFKKLAERNIKAKHRKKAEDEASRVRTFTFESSNRFNNESGVHTDGLHAKNRNSDNTSSATATNTATTTTTSTTSTTSITISPSGNTNSNLNRSNSFITPGSPLVKDLSKFVGVATSHGVTHVQISQKIAEHKRILRQKMKEYQIMGFAEVVSAPTFEIGKSILLQTAGLGGMKPNTVVTGWPTKWMSTPNGAALFLDTFEEIRASQKAFIVVKGLSHFPDMHDSMTGNIDIWWVVRDGGLLLLIGHLLTMHKVWKKCKLRLFTVAELSDNSVEIENQLSLMLDQLRIPAKVKVIEMSREEFDPFTSEWTVKGNAGKKMTKAEIKRVTSHGYFPTLIDDIPGVAHPPKPRIQQEESLSHVSAGPEVIVMGPSSTVSSIDDDQLENGASFSATQVGFQSTEALLGLGESTGITRIPSSAPSAEAAVLAESWGASTSSFASQRKGDKYKKTSISSHQYKSYLKINATLKLRDAIEMESSSSALVILNLPAPDLSAVEDPAKWMQLMEMLTDKLPRSVLVHGSGRRVVSIYG